MISREELDRIRKMASEFISPPRPRAGYETNALYDKLREAVMLNLTGLLKAADAGVSRPKPKPRDDNIHVTIKGDCGRTHQSFKEWQQCPICETGLRNRLLSGWLTRGQS